MKTLNQDIGNKHFVVQPHMVSFKKMDDAYSIKWKRKDYPQKNIHTIQQLMTKMECKELISFASELGFQPAGLAVGQDIYRVKEKTRNNLRVIFEDTELARLLWDRMGHLAPSKFNNHTKWGLNWRFRVYEYPTGGIFTPHVDERMDLGDGKITLYTFMIYLNENLDGGATTFFEKKKSGQRKLIPNRIIQPKVGKALFFDHLLSHEGSEVTSGKKYVLRSDIIYKK